MTRKQKIQKLKELKNYLIIYKEYKPKEIEKQKVLVLKKEFKGRYIKL
jgi:hypothetical protein